MEIKLSNSSRRIWIDDSDYEKVSKYSWYLCSSGSGSPQIRASALGKLATQNKKVLIHRIILDCPRGLVVDHINRDQFDNRKSNLRICTNSENTRNQGRRKSAKNLFKGVAFIPATKKWNVRLQFEKKLVYCATFQTKEAAAIAYDLAVKSWHGEFASCNLLSNGGF